MIKLTAPNGDPVEVNPDAIEEMYVNPGTFSTNARSVLLIGG